MEEQFRNKITWFSFGFSILVVWIHSCNLVFDPGNQSPGAALAARVEHWLGEGVGQIAVPGFFMISGYLFYRNCTWKDVPYKMKSRARSILVPYMAWNFLYYLGYVIAGRLPRIGRVVGRGVIPVSVPAVLEAVFRYTFNPVFWYLFQLILLVLLAPALYPLLHGTWSRWLLLAFLWIAVALDLRLPYVNADALIYYCSGAVLATEAAGRKQAEAPAHPWPAGALLVCGAVLAYQVGLCRAWIPGFVLCRLLGVAGAWMLVPAGRLPAAGACMEYNFFLYATHFPQVRFLNKAGERVFAGNPAAALALYLVMPALVVGITCPAGSVLKRKMSRVWRILNGGR